MEMNEYTLDQLETGLQETIEVDVTEEMIDEFCKFSGDFSSIHVDNGFAQGKEFKQRLVHGVLVGSFVSNLIGMKLPGKNGVMQEIDLTFRNPCYAPNHLKVTGTVLRCTESVKQAQIGIEVTDQEEVLIVKGKVKVVVS